MNSRLFQQRRLLIWLTALFLAVSFALGFYFIVHHIRTARLLAAQSAEEADETRITIPEGSTVFDINTIIVKHYPNFDQNTFLTIAKPREGYLFPDTYMLGSNPTPESVLTLLTTTFTEKTTDASTSQAISSFGKPLSEVVTMASILEGEARQSRTRRIVAGILWNRIKKGIPLQVDAAFRYINGKTSEELTSADLKIDSPYNTYIYKGFPPTPISNPGIEAIMDAVTPIQTNYLYFLTDGNGVMHYATTLAEHDANIEKYLK